MLDFYSINVTKYRKGAYDYKIQPQFSYSKHKDIVCKGGAFYAFWDEEKNTWDENISHLIERIDNDIREEIKKRSMDGVSINALFMDDSTSGRMNDFIVYAKQVRMKDIPFNSKVLFKSDEYSREQYSTTRLQYDPSPGPTEAFDTLIDTLYLPEEKEKIMWFMGALLCGAMPKIQKFMFLHGGKGTGKGTVIEIFKEVFKNYYSPIDLRKLTSGEPFATSEVREIPLLIDSDCNMYNIKNDAELLKLTSHEEVIVDIKYKTPYPVIFNGLLIAASNQSYRVRNVDSGIMRRAVTVYPSNNTLSYEDYFDLMERIKFEVPQIAYKAQQVFKKLGSGYFNSYEDLVMAAETDYFLDFMREKYEVIKQNMDDHNGYLLGKDYAAYFLDYLKDNEWDTTGYKKRANTEGKRFFKHVYTRRKVNGVDCRNVFSGLLEEKIFGKAQAVKPVESKLSWIHLKEQHSLLDDIFASMTAQYANSKGYPRYSWDACTTKLKDLDTKRLHYLFMPNESYIVIDFDIPDEDGNKSLELNLEAASKFPKTYCEVSKSGQALHLHYIYDGDVNDLSNVYEPHIEIKVYKGKASLRRKLSLCNDIPIAHISTGLPLRERGEKVFGDIEDITLNTKGMTTMIERCMHKEYHDSTSQNVNYIYSILESQAKKGVKYDLRYLKPLAITFASNSTNQSSRCMKLMNDATWCTISDEDSTDISKGSRFVEDKDLWFFDIEVLPNLWLVVIKRFGEPCQAFFNPTPSQVRDICDKALVGFNNKSYDNQILYAGLMGRSISEIYDMSKEIIEGGRSRYNKAAEELSYTDIYDFASTKQSLKKWEVELGILHDEFELDFDKPLPEEKWERLAEYCTHDVEATEKLFVHLYSDYTARKIASALSGLSMNASTNAHSSQYVFGDEPNPQKDFIYPDLSEEFEGYQFNEYGVDRALYSVPDNLIVGGKSVYLGEDPSEGGYVYSKPGVYGYCKTYDISSMHPSTIRWLNLFGKHTQRYLDLVDARLAIKHGDLDTVRAMFDGKLKPFISDTSDTKELSNALKIMINSVYGLTAQKKPSKDNRFRDPRNVDNVVAKRGALFMIKLKHEVMDRGAEVVHIKTDSIKIANPTKEIEDFIFEFGKSYGYTFEVEDEWKRLALINKSVFVGETIDGEWKVKGAQFAVPYVYKKLFTKEDICRDDYSVVKEVRSAIYLGDYPVREEGEKLADFKQRKQAFDIPTRCTFVGRIARVYASNTGMDVIRYDSKKGTMGFVQDTKGHKWRLYSDFVSNKDIDMSYYNNLVIDAIKAINKVGASASIVMEPLDALYSEYLTFF